MSGGEASGVDLARVALRAAMEAPRKNGGSQRAKQKPRPVRTVRLGALVTEQAWELPAAADKLALAGLGLEWAAALGSPQRRWAPGIYPGAGPSS
ncbi:hypothetical protein [Streptomyces sp. NPDC088261]|uniref:hypothetical protein n=1 Tax=Streptomyces sp. NPDC088261 TaxID=3365851 RepID=UPI00380C3D84